MVSKIWLHHGCRNVFKGLHKWLRKKSGWYRARRYSFHVFKSVPHIFGHVHAYKSARFQTVEIFKRLSGCFWIDLSHNCLLIFKLIKVKSAVKSLSFSKYCRRCLPDDLILQSRASNSAPINTILLPKISTTPKMSGIFVLQSHFCL